MDAYKPLVSPTVVNVGLAWAVSLGLVLFMSIALTIGCRYARRRHRIRHERIQHEQRAHWNLVRERRHQIYSLRRFSQTVEVPEVAPALSEHNDQQQPKPPPDNGAWAKKTLWRLAVWKPLSSPATVAAGAMQEKLRAGCRRIYERVKKVYFETSAARATARTNECANTGDSSHHDAATYHAFPVASVPSLIVPWSPRPAHIQLPSRSSSHRLNEYLARSRWSSSTAGAERQAMIGNRAKPLPIPDSSASIATMALTATSHANDKNNMAVATCVSSAEASPDRGIKESGGKAERDWTSNELNPSCTSVASSIPAPFASQLAQANTFLKVCTANCERGNKGKGDGSPDALPRLRSPDFSAAQTVEASTASDLEVEPLNADEKDSQHVHHSINGTEEKLGDLDDQGPRKSTTRQATADGQDRQCHFPLPLDLFEIEPGNTLQAAATNVEDYYDARTSASSRDDSLASWQRAAHMVQSASDPSPFSVDEGKNSNDAWRHKLEDEKGPISARNMSLAKLNRRYTVAVCGPTALCVVQPAQQNSSRGSTKASHRRATAHGDESAARIVCCHERAVSSRRCRSAVAPSRQRRATRSGVSAGASVTSRPHARTLRVYKGMPYQHD